MYLEAGEFGVQIDTTGDGPGDVPNSVPKNAPKNASKFNPNFDEKKNVVIEQGGNYWKPITSTKYYGANRKIILVNRNPKAIFWSMKRRNSLSYPSHDVEIFVNWYYITRSV